MRSVNLELDTRLTLSRRADNIMIDNRTDENGAGVVLRSVCRTCNHNKHGVSSWMSTSPPSAAAQQGHVYKVTLDGG